MLQTEEEEEEQARVSWDVPSFSVPIRWDVSSFPPLGVTKAGHFNTKDLQSLPCYDPGVFTIHNLSMLCIYIYIYILCIKQYISHTLYHHFIIYPDIVLYPIYKNYGRFLYLIFLHGENPKSKKKKTQARRMARRLEARSKSRSRPNFYGLEEVIQHFPGGETP